MDDATQTLSVQAMQGFEDNALISTALRLTGTDPRKMQYPVKDITPEELALFQSGHLQHIKGGLYVAFVHKFPKAVCTAVEHLLNIRFIYTMGFVHHDRHLGGVFMVTDSESAIEANRLIIENIVAQAASVIGRIHEEELLRNSEERFIVTGDISDQNTRAFLEQNNLAYISKPFDREALLQKVNTALV